MKLATYQLNSGGDAEVGVVIDGGIVNLASCGFEGDMKSLLAAGIDIAAIEASLGKGNRFSEDEVSLLAPIPHPGKVLAIGLNYGDHIAESGMEAPKHQVWFNKQHNCVNGPYSDINLPSVSPMLDYEAELCLVISRKCKHVPKERAHEVIGGYFCGNDVSVRDWQMRAQTFQIGKSFDTHGPIGPWLVTPDEVGDPHDLDIRCFVNGEERQNSNTRHLIFDCYDAIAHLTQAFTLDVGDVLFMGTPAGVGAAMKPPAWLQEGDKVRVEIDKLGYIENTVVAESADTIIG
ncbi:MAG: fumarylacetoacetate hydrolase family protein [Pseudomonadales bacterium]|nr:fumarylacetoacetate hydrolase family protein [Pseudomonadales bacterium]